MGKCGFLSYVLIHPQKKTAGLKQKLIPVSGFINKKVLITINQTK